MVPIAMFVVGSWGQGRAIISDPKLIVVSTKIKKNRSANNGFLNVVDF